MSNWISVKDRLPVDICYVLAFGKSDYHVKDHILIGWTNGDKWYEVSNAGNGVDYDAVVTHWQPLPAPPAEGE